jgi:hypothetical protein
MAVVHKILCLVVSRIVKWRDKKRPVVAFDLNKKLASS